MGEVHRGNSEGEVDVSAHAARSVAVKESRQEIRCEGNQESLAKEQDVKHA